VQKKTIFFAWFCSMAYFSIYAASPMPSDSAATLRKEIEPLSVYEILTLANNASLDNCAKALYYADLAFEKAQKTGSGKDKYDAAILKSFIYENNNRLEEALSASFKAREVARMIGIEQILDASNNIAILYRKLGKYALCKQFHTITLDLARQNNSVEFQEYSYNGLGTLYEITGEYDISVEYHLKSLSLSEQKKSNKNTIISYHNIANTYRQAKQYSKALVYIEKAYQLSSTIPEDKEDGEAEYERAKLLHTYGKILVEQGNLDLGLQKYRAVMKIYERKNFRSRITPALISIANVYTLKQDYSTAEQYLLRCFEYQAQMSERDLANLYNKLGNLYTLTNRVAEAEKILLDCLKKSTTIDYKEVTQNTHQLLYQIYKNKGNNQIALMHFEAALALGDSLYSEQKIHRIADLQYKFDTEQSDKELQALAVRESNFWLITGMICVVSLFVFIGTLAYWRGRNTRLLEQKNQEIEERNKMLLEANTILKQFAYAAAHDLKEPLRNIGSFASLLQRRYGKTFKEEANDYMTFISIGIRRMTSLLEDLMHYSTDISKKEHGEI
jgi:tetratricopeptide (TPR) repeat protein